MHTFASDFKKSLTCWGRRQSAVGLANLFRCCEVLYLVSGWCMLEKGTRTCLHRKSRDGKRWMINYRSHCTLVKWISCMAYLTNRKKLFQFLLLDVCFHTTRNPHQQQKCSSTWYTVTLENRQIRLVLLYFNCFDPPFSSKVTCHKQKTEHGCEMVNVFTQWKCLSREEWIYHIWGCKPYSTRFIKAINTKFKCRY